MTNLVEKPAYGPKATERSSNRSSSAVASSVVARCALMACPLRQQCYSYQTHAVSPGIRMMDSLLRFGTAHNRAHSRIARSVRLTPAAAIFVTPAAPAIVVTAKAGTTVVTVESIRVAAPPRVPEVAWARQLRQMRLLAGGAGPCPQNAHNSPAVTDISRDLG